MSLVADYSDSESDEEKEEDVEKEDPKNILKSKSVETIKNENLGNVINIENNITEGNDQDETFDINDEDDWENNILGNQDIILNDSDPKLFVKLPEPKSNKYEDFKEEADDEFLKKKPIPEKEILKEQTEGKTEKTVNHPNNSETSLKKQLLNIPTSKNKKGPVKISIPTLQEIGADSDSDSEEKEKKIPKPSTIKSSLFSVLPKPKYSVTVGANKNRVFEKKENRSLIPHTLTKKAEKKPITKKNQSKSEKKSIENTESDSDEEDISSNSFFSLSKTDTADSVNKQKETTSSTVDIKLKDSVIETEDHSISVSIQKTESPVTKNNSYFSSLLTKSNNKNISKNSKTSNSEILNNNKSVGNVSKASTIASTTKNSLSKTVKCDANVTAPYGVSSDNSFTSPFGKNNDIVAPYGKNNDVIAPYGKNDVTAPYGISNHSSVTAPYGNTNSEVTAPYGSTSSDVTVPYGNNVTGLYNSNKPMTTYSYPKDSNDRFFSYAYEKATVENQSQPATDFYNQPNEDLPIDRSALTALQGRKRRKEDIKIIDINADNLQQNNEDYLKNLTKQTAHQSKKAKKDQPSQGEKRKHQITYLAFQAKEREIELQQAWAENRATKQQTQSRYGF